jgi:hypothetical protein
MKAAVDAALSGLPYGTPDELRAKALQTATDAVLEVARKSGELSRYQDFVLIAKAAIQPVVAVVLRRAHEREFERWKVDLIDGYWSGFLDSTQAERDDGEQAIQEAFANVSSDGMTRAKLEQIRDKALDPIRARITARKEKHAATARAALAPKVIRCQKSRDEAAIHHRPLSHHLQAR